MTEMTYVAAPKLGFPARLSLGISLIVTGMAMQFLLPGFGWLLGCVVMVGAAFLFASKGLTNEPDDQGLEEWRPVSVAEIDRIADNLRLSRKIRLPFILSKAGGVIVAIACGAIAFFFGFGSSSVGIAATAALILLAIPLLTGSIKVWIPHDLRMKMECVQAVLSVQLPAGIAITPYLRFDKDKEGKDVPEDVRLMLEPKNKRDDVVGVQLQAAINKGENGAVPYLYAVVLTKGGGRSFRQLSGMSVPGYEVEAGEPGEYGAVVVRQDTGAGGYRTSASDCERLLGVSLKILEALKA